MKLLIASVALGAAFMIAPQAFAAEQTVKLSVPGMSCASCPYMVKSAISKVDGIASVEATMADRSATVIFDDTVTDIAEIQEATENIGYPSSVVETTSGS